MYLLLKHLHMTFVVLSFITFLLRGIWMLRGSRLLERKLVKILPHIINTILILSGIVLAVYLNMSPGSQPWLLAKIIGLVVYITLGVFAFKVASPTLRLGLWLAALVVFVQITSMAVHKNPLGLLAAF
ncbi:SirB2 family protein [Cellvibrio japonicus]|uniref:Putative membrane protein n=1 Tax=Cellvibrio japonicus (strain Ueda107) TaxID=498211 RepID=B3PJ86_CELJU|nr:SirB2 family protein [Cellvibrio japonicus]ACE85116.1 putative membrane protein [Cellvibrio japonicus Ueda107]QEI12640.1 regulator SirB [Cellvibrio japonicus]QEI16214.1 regulator SirB [Cellvibrio japonicus]QEI19792.1 regulator SirB [Cellvibrio japonicus]